MIQLDEFSVGQIWQYVGEGKKWEVIKGPDDPETFVILIDISNDVLEPEPLTFQMVSSRFDTALTYSLKTIRAAFQRIS